jgi:quercetin dioxygenase-like cupin family protein
MGQAPKSQDAPRPVLVGDSTTALDPAGLSALPGGARWQLAESPRQLDANVIHLPAGHQVETHAEPALDVLLHVLEGTGRLLTPDEAIDLTPGRLLWLPRGSRRSLVAGPDGLSYLTVHVRRPGMGIGRPQTE